jgi:L-2,4-diaminobutyrate decarboxylase
MKPPDTPDAAALFDPERFRATGREVVDRLADYLARAAAGAGEGMPVLPWRDPTAMLEQWPADFGEGPSAEGGVLLDRVLAQSNHLHHPHYVGHQVSAPLPEAAIWSMVTSLLNNGLAVYEMGPSGMAIERALLRWMAGRLGLGGGADGIFTSGGSLGNLTALLAARQARAGFDAWGQGDHAGPPLAVLVGDQAHYSIRRAVQMMGWGEGGAVAVPTDARFRMMPAALDDARRRAEAAGRRPIAVVASACSTATGSFDPLEPIADWCAKSGLWLHVDGAHGASAALSPAHRPLLAGIERADSVVWDAHKMMLMPSLLTAVLFRDGGRSYEAFAQSASYLFDGSDPKAEWFNHGTRTLECTKPSMALKLYAALALNGTGPFARHLAATLDLARRFAARIQAAPDFELAVEPEANIVCFRYRPKDARSAGDLDAIQTAIRRRLLESGKFYLTQTRLPAGLYLRVTLINPLTRDEHLQALLEAIRDVVAERRG